MLLLGGVNNGNHQATLVVLDPLKIAGLMTPKDMSDHRFELLDIPAAHEQAVVFFPRSCISLGEPYTRVLDVAVTKQRIVVYVAEGSDTGHAGFHYEMDFDLDVLDVGPTGVEVKQAHEALEERHILDHPFVEDEECARLKAGVVVRRSGQ
jgi:hypothetical protein